MRSYLVPEQGLDHTQFEQTRLVEFSLRVLEAPACLRQHELWLGPGAKSVFGIVFALRSAPAESLLRLLLGLHQAIRNNSEYP